MAIIVLLAVFTLTSGVLGVIYYVMYVRVRMKDRGHPDEPRFNEVQLKEMDRLEERYLSRHFTWMLFFFLAGIALLGTIAYK